MQTEEIIEEVCPTCGTILTDKNYITDPLKELNRSSSTAKPIKRFKWWVTPLNVLVVCIFILSIDVFTGSNKNPYFYVDWAFWPIIGILSLFFIATLLTKRPESFWIVGPLIFVNISLLLFFIDRAYGDNTGILGLDWAHIPISILLTFGFLIPVISRLGYRKPTAEEKFKRHVGEL